MSKKLKQNYLIDVNKKNRINRNNEKKPLIIYFNEEKGKKCNRIIEKKGKNYKKTSIFYEYHGTSSV